MEGKPGKITEAKPAKKGDDQQPATFWQKVIVVCLGMYLISLIYLVLSKHWLGVLPF